MQQPVLPSWFKQRQAKAEPAGETTYKLTGPNLGEAYITLRPGNNGRWAAAVMKGAAGPDVAATGTDFPTPGDAWDAAFELYRRHFIV